MHKGPALVVFEERRTWRRFRRFSGPRTSLVSHYVFWQMKEALWEKEATVEVIFICIARAAAPCTYERYFEILGREENTSQDWWSF